MANRSDDSKIRAEAKFKKKELQTKEGEKVWAEREAAGRLSDAKTIRLRALRLAKEAAEKAAKPPKKPPMERKKPPI
jgi:hypothetical protein